MACIIVWDPVAQSLSVMGERNPWDLEGSPWGSDCPYAL